MPARPHTAGVRNRTSSARGSTHLPAGTERVAGRASPGRRRAWPRRRPLPASRFLLHQEPVPSGRYSSTFAKRVPRPSAASTVAAGSMPVDVGRRAGPIAELGDQLLLAKLPAELGARRRRCSLLATTQTCADAPHRCNVGAATTRRRHATGLCPWARSRDRQGGTKHAARRGEFSSSSVPSHPRIHGRARDDAPGTCHAPSCRAHEGWGSIARDQPSWPPQAPHGSCSCFALDLDRSAHPTGGRSSPGHGARGRSRARGRTRRLDGPRARSPLFSWCARTASRMCARKPPMGYRCQIR